MRLRYERFDIPWIMYPFHKIPVGKEVQAQHGSHDRDGPPRFREMMHPLDQQQGDQGCPNLDHERVFACPDKGFDFQILFQGFEKQLDFPAIFVDGGDGGGSEVEMIGEQDDLPLIVCIPDHDAAHGVRAFLFRDRAGVSDDLVRLDVAVLGRRARFDDLKGCVRFLAGDEKDAFPGPVGEQIVVRIGHIHGDDRAGIEMQPFSDLDFVAFGLLNVDEDGHVGVVIEQGVDLDTTFLASEFGPGEKGKTKGDDGGVQRQKLVFEAKARFATAKPAVVLKMPVTLEEQVAEKAGRTVLIGIR